MILVKLLIEYGIKDFSPNLNGWVSTGLSLTGFPINSRTGNKELLYQGLHLHGDT